MLARFVLASLLLEVAGYASIGTWLYGSRGWAPGALLALAVALALAARLLVVLLSSMLAWVYRSPREPARRLGLAGIARLVLGEWRVMLADNWLYLPFERFVVRRDSWEPSPRVPVMLVHGYMSNRGYFGALVRWLEARGGGPVFTPNFPVLFTDIGEFASRLHARIEQVAASTGQARVVLVCHSMGGLAAREYLRLHGTGRIERLVTIASPHHGTALANFGLGANARQMCQGCEFFAALERSEGEAGPGVETLSIYTVHDNLVAPQETSRLPWATNVALSGMGHVGILAAPALFAALEKALPAEASR